MVGGTNSFLCADFDDFHLATTDMALQMGLESLCKMSCASTRFKVLGKCLLRLVDDLLGFSSI